MPRRNSVERDLRKPPFTPLCLCASFSNLQTFDNCIFMNSRNIVASAVSCESGNKNDFLCWVLICLLSQFLGARIAFVNFHLFKAVDRSPSFLRILESFG
ncbi:hypothetical protein MKW98_010297 [Papaver atlanticum]|uniref:Uncharacterized protein n=1 Tax=Papaver atlanticum TaxID=357466 RepID=A0AAD4SMU9_9MAGN|nr:hypothetical protein MKW98_010297 [Papaver atlanticum]